MHVPTIHSVSYLDVTMISAVDFLEKEIGEAPSLCVILGSGLQLEGQEIISFPYTDIPEMSAPQTAGHTGTLRVIENSGTSAAVLSGRRHLYEGAEWEEVIFATRMLAKWGIRNLIVTNAAGGISHDLAVGDLMLIDNVIDLLSPKMRARTVSVLIEGPQRATSELNDRIGEIAPAIKKGTYAAVLGPNYETKAEVKALKKAGADAVGMSTVPELMTAAELRLPATGLSVITNSWAEESVSFHGHEDVVSQAGRASEQLQELIEELLRLID
mgnify:FL=1